MNNNKVANLSSLNCFAKIFTCILLWAANNQMAAADASITAELGAAERASLNTLVTQNGSVYDISQGTQKGSIVFHGFEQFGLMAGETANFNTNSDVKNIVARVTGKSYPSDGVSRIDGTLNSPNASLWVMNPNGVVLGSHAQLNINGAFNVTRGKEIYFENGSVFTDKSTPPLDLGPTAILNKGFSPISQPDIIASSAPEANLQTLVSHDGFDYRISKGTNSGGVTFHGFDHLNLQPGERLWFDTPGLVVARVIGGASTIEGEIKAPGDLIILNPDGLYINATFDVGSSIYFSTADSVLFSNQQFSATSSAPTLNSPELTGFGFVGLEQFSNDCSCDIEIGKLWVKHPVRSPTDFRQQSTFVVGRSISMFNSDYSAYQGGIATSDHGPYTATDKLVAMAANKSMDLSIDLSEYRPKLPYAEHQYRDAFLQPVIANGDGDFNFGGRILLNGALISSDTKYSQVSLAAENIIISRSEFRAQDKTQSVFETIAGNLAFNDSVFYKYNSYDETPSNSIENVRLFAKNRIHIEDSLITYGSLPGNLPDSFIWSNGSLELSNGASIDYSPPWQRRPMDITDGGPSATPMYLNIYGKESVTLDGAKIIMVQYAYSGSLSKGPKDLPGPLLSLRTDGDLNLIDSAVTVSVDKERRYPAYEYFTRDKLYRSENGSAKLTGENIYIKEGKQKSGSKISSERPFSTNVGPTISLVATDKIEVSGANSGIFTDVGGQDFSAFASANFTDIEPSSVAARVLLEAPNIKLTNGATISAETTGTGNAGSIRLNAKNALDIDSGSAISTSSQSTAKLVVKPNSLNTDDTGNVSFISIDKIVVKESELLNGAPSNAILGSMVRNSDGTGSYLVESKRSYPVNRLIFTDDGFALPNISGSPGEITVNAGSVTLDNGSIIGDNKATGVTQGATIAVNTDALALKNGGAISASSGSDVRSIYSGAGGTINIVASKGVSLEGPETKITNQAFAYASGTAGNIRINSPSISIYDRASITSATSGAKHAGSIDLAIERRLDLAHDAAISSSTYGQGHAGNVTISAAPGSVISIAGSVASASCASELDCQTPTANRGSAGFIKLKDGEYTVSGEITTSTVSSNPRSGTEGVIDIFTQGVFDLEGKAQISTATFSAADAGIITIAVPELNLSNQAQIKAKTSSLGNAGSIDLITDRLTLDSDRAVASTADASGIFSSSAGDSAALGAPGVISIDAKERVTLNGGVIDSTTAQTVAAQNQGGIFINSPKVELKNGGTITAASSSNFDTDSYFVSIKSTDLSLSEDSKISSDAQGAGKASGIKLDATKIDLNGAAQIRSNALATGGAGSIDIRSDQLCLAEQAQISAKSTGQGSAGNIDLNIKKQLDLADGAAISSSTYGQGNAGNVTINATPGSVISVAGSVASASCGSEQDCQKTAANRGSAGSIKLKDGNYLVKGEITTSTVSDTVGSGSEGVIDISTEGTLFLEDDAKISTQTLAKADAGAILVDAADVSIKDSAQIQAKTQGAGKAGEVKIKTGALTINANSAQSSSGQEKVTARELPSTLIPVAGIYSSSEGDALSIGAPGNIIVDATEQIILDAGSIDTSTASTVAGATSDGTITLNSPIIKLKNGALVTSESKSGADAGNITLNVADGIKLEDSKISTSAANANGGNIAIQNGNATTNSRLLQLNKSTISASAGTNGGNITIAADTIINIASTVKATGERGTNGDVVFTSPQLDVSTLITDLSVPVLDASRLLQQTCSAASARKASSFVVNKKPLNLAPGGYRLSRLNHAALPAADTKNSLPAKVLKLPGNSIDCKSIAGI